MLAWVYDAAARCELVDEVAIACDSDEVMELCRREGLAAMLTDPALSSGSDRVHAAAEAIARAGRPAEIVINLQGDEPLALPQQLDVLLAPFADSAVQVATLKTRCSDEDVHNPNAVKVVTAPDGRALYFSRSAIPFDRDGAGAPVWKHLGLYAFRARALNSFHDLLPTPLEQTERLEQLRLLENGIAIHVAETPHDSIGVDTPEDLKRVERLLLERAR